MKELLSVELPPFGTILIMLISISVFDFPKRAVSQMIMTTLVALGLFAISFLIF
jgi:hypothetical protein